ncbi:hypothetical protein BU16DRAFT_619980 [Lophium mytilinum]|uniref:F-box domain-containing protein n=1 Tax=Lophium mytilinum TaxID=390894 RepID=A0A6A6QKF4_9PEZI|nr:hypothetical protein BU16DRAFT_619980 [Lophium mytilinum]
MSAPQTRHRSPIPLLALTYISPLSCRRVSTRGGFSFSKSSEYDPKLLKIQRTGMVLSRGWIIHSLEATPAILTEEDITTASLEKITEFYQGVKMLMLLRLGDLPQDLRDVLINRPALDFYGILYAAVDSGMYTDISWVEEWSHAVTEVSIRMRGYPRELRKQMRLIADASRTPSGRQAVVEKEKRSDTDRKFLFLDLPEKIRDQVYRHLLVKESIIICDWAAGSDVQSVKRRTDYEVRVGKEQRRTTYQVRAIGKKQEIDLAIMRANKQIADESAKVFYGENTLRFLGCMDSALSFLHDHARHFDTVQRVEIRYSCDIAASFKGCYNMTCPIPLVPYTWPHSVNFLVHCSRGLVDFKLILDDTFWKATPSDLSDPRGSARTVFFTDNLCDPPWAKNSSPNKAIQNCNSPKFVARNFLQHIARLGGVNTTLDIEGWDKDAERQRFARELMDVIVENTLQRPYLADDAKPECVCRTRLLKESCIWDRDGKVRRR